jgi:hypothetical protein
MAFDFKAATPGTAPASALLFGADSQVAANPSVYTSTGSGNVVLSTSPTLVTPTLGTPSSGTLTNCTGLPVGSITGLGTGVATALAVNIGSAGAFVTFNGALGTPSSGTLTSCTGLPISTGVSGLGTGIATFLATPSSANLAAAVTDETGTGPLVFANSPTFTDDITLGTQQTTQGAIILANTAAGAFATTIKSSNSASAAWTLTLPTTAGTNNDVLKTDGSGNTSWVAQSGGGGSPGGNSGQYQYNNGGAFAGIGLILFADTTFYVRTDGNNANNGLANTSGGAWATIQYAVDYMAGVDANGYGVTIQVGDGSYAAASAGNYCLSILYRPRNALFYNITGNTTTPANVEIDGVDQTPYGFAVGNNYAASGAASSVVVEEISGFRLINAFNFAYVTDGSSASFLNCESADNYEFADAVGWCYASFDNIVLSGNHSILVTCDRFSRVYLGFAVTFATSSTVAGTVYIAYPYGYIETVADYTNLTSSGAKYYVDNLGYLYTYGNSASIPGSAGVVEALGALN